MTEVFVHNPVETRFEAWVDGEFVGELVYSRRGAAVVFESTHLNTRTVVKGLGGRLVHYAFGYVREKGDLKVAPVCPFVRSWVESHAEVNDLLV